MQIYTLSSDGPPLATEQDALDAIGQSYGTGAELMVIPVSRLPPDFFRLSTGLAGAILQKFTNYQFKVAIIGDISAHLEKSAPLRDFVRESNRRGDVRFLASQAEL